MEEIQSHSSQRGSYHQHAGKLWPVFSRRLLLFHCSAAVSSTSCALAEQPCSFRAPQHQSAPAGRTNRTRRKTHRKVPPQIALQSTHNQTYFGVVPYSALFVNMLIFACSLFL